jgi:hypothetical protein
MRIPSAILLLLAGIVGLSFASPMLLQQSRAISHLTSLPEWLAAAALICLGVTAAIFLGLIRFPRTQMQLTPLSTPNEFRLLPKRLHDEHVRNRTTLLAAAALPALALAAYAESALHPVPLGAHLLGATSALLLLLLILHLVRNKLSKPRSTEPQLTLTASQPRLDEPFHLRLRIEALTSVQLPEYRARFVCFEHKLLHTGRYVQLSIYPHSEKTITLADEVTLAAHQVLSASAEVLFDSSAHLPTGQPGITMYPFYHWEIHLHPPGHPRATTIFPLNVAPSPKRNAAEEMTPSLSDVT